MDGGYALEPDEFDAGFVLACQAHPHAEHAAAIQHLFEYLSRPLDEVTLPCPVESPLVVYEHPGRSPVAGSLLLGEASETATAVLGTKRAGGPLEVGGSHPQDHPAAPRAGAGRRTGRDVDVRLRELRRRVGHGAHAVVALNEKPPASPR